MKGESLKLFEEVTREIFREQSEEFTNNVQTYEEQIREFNKREKEVIDNIDKLINFPTILEAKNRELENIKIQREKLEKKANFKPISTNLEQFLYHSKKVVTRLDKLALQKGNPELINLVFDIIFDGKIEYEKIEKHTPVLTEFSSPQSQQKNPKNRDLIQKNGWYTNDKN